MSNTIYHYGVKGMRWGHRKRKEMRSYRNEQYKKHVTESAEQKRFTKLEEENDRIDAKRKAGTLTLKDNERYQKNIEKMYELADIADNNARIKADQDLINKYGQKDVSRLEKYDKNAPRRREAITTGVTAATSALILTGYLAIKDIQIRGEESLVIKSLSKLAGMKTTPRSGPMTDEELRSMGLERV